MAVSGGMKLARSLGIITLILAWTAAGIEYFNSGNIRWTLIAAGILFAVLPFSSGGTKGTSA
jgi:hypothetical protein